MSTAVGYAGYVVGQSYGKDHGMISLDAGEEFRLRVEQFTLGSEVRKTLLDICRSEVVPSWFWTT